MKTYIVLGLLIAFLWGLAPIVLKSLQTNLNYFTIMFFSSMIYFICVLVLCFINRNEFMRDINSITAKEIAILVSLPVVALFFANYLYYNLLKRHESALIVALVCCSPIFTLLLAYLFMNERISQYGIAGILMVCGGVGLISLN
jgi:drug/metabolite transporter (DMT)-like permease